SGTLDALLYRSGGGLLPSMISCFIVLSIPAFLIGCTVPLFAGYKARLEESQGGASFSRAYTIYNFGAALTALLSEIVLVRNLGLERTVLVIASINGLVSAGMLAFFRPLIASGPVPAKAPSSIARRDLIALGLASIA